MPPPRLRHVLTTGAAAAATTAAVVTVLYHLGHCRARNGDARCVHALDHLHDHSDRRGNRWVDGALLRRRATIGVMFSAGATPAGPEIIRGPKDLLRRIAYCAHPGESD